MSDERACWVSTLHESEEVGQGSSKGFTYTEKVSYVGLVVPALALDPGLRLIGDSEKCDVGLLLGGSPSCGGSMLLASSSASSISSCAGHASGGAGRLLRHHPHLQRRC